MDARTPRATTSVRAEFDRYGGIEGLNRAADAVESLMDSEGWRILSVFVEKEREHTDRTLDTATEPLSKAKYAQLHGRRSGLTAFHDHAKALIAHRARVMEEQRLKHEQEPVSAGPDGR